MSQSEVARLRAQIEAECIAMKQVFQGFAITASHDIINHRYDQLGLYQNRLERLVGQQKALDAVIEIYNRVVQ